MSTPATQEARFPCGQCGAKLEYNPGAASLKCPYCGHEQEIPQSIDEIQELDFHAYLAKNAPPVADEPDRVLHCNQCAAEFTWPENQKSGACPFCGSNVVVPADPEARVEPRSLLPFAIDLRAAKAHFSNWIGTRFWAPNNLKALALAENGLRGCYIPYWTYDSYTITAYTGQRGEHYYTTESYTDSNGNRQTRQVRRTRWYPASGVVHVPFDDVLVLASHHLPPRYASAMDSWDLKSLTPYDPAFLSGFVAMRYDIDLGQGFDNARAIMAPHIHRAICRDIGGDEQIVNSSRTEYRDVTFKHILLPIWSGAYRYGGKSWSYLVNGQTGEVRGEAPVSPWKVALAILLGLVVLALLIHFNQGPQ